MRSALATIVSNEGGTNSRVRERDTGSGPRNRASSGSVSCAAPTAELRIITAAVTAPLNIESTSKSTRTAYVVTIGRAGCRQHVVYCCGQGQAGRIRTCYVQRRPLERCDQAIRYAATI